MKKLIKKFTHSCSLDCYDLCKFDVYKKGDKVTKIMGSSENKFTKGIICTKGRKHVERLYSKDRLTVPLLKVDGGWKEISFDEAVGLIADKLNHYKKNYGSQSVIHYAESGAGGVLKGIEDIFFNFYGGITTTTGSTCWGAGNQAQKYDFGERRCSDIDDLSGANTVILWGRNPYNTSIHLYERLVQAKKKGVKIVTIDPRINESSRISDLHLSPNPSTDGALAMAVTKVLIEGGVDSSYIEKNIHGYEKYREYLDTLSMEYLLDETGLNIDEVRELAKVIGDKPVSCFLGYGMQKYTNGGNTIRAIDALMSISGNVGIKGGGVFYSNRVYPNILDTDPYKSEKEAVNSRTFPVAGFVDYINNMTLETAETPIKSIFITKCNPMNQYANLTESIDAFNKIEFKVCIDMFMTDTAKYCDLVLPCTNTLESEDIIYSSMHSPYLLYNEQVVEPANELMDEYFFFQKLAEKMEIDEYPQVDKNTYINKILKSVDLDIEKLRGNSINLATWNVAWEEGEFPTPSGKIEIYSEIAKKDGQTPMPAYIPSLKKTKEFPIRLISPHFKNSLFSQHSREKEGRSRLYAGSGNIGRYKDGDVVKLSSKYGEISCTIHLDDTLKDDIVYMYAGWNHKHGNPNFLTYNGSSEMGGQVTYYDTFVKID